MAILSKDEADKEAKKILKRARRKARRIVKDAEKEADKKVGDAENLKREIEKEYRETLQKVVDEVAVSLTEKALMDINKFNDELKERVKTSKEAEEKLIGDEFDQIKKEIAAYKEQKLADVDKRINEVIKEVTKKFLGEAINMSEHKDLVIKALNDAKRRNLL